MITKPLIYVSNHISNIIGIVAIVITIILSSSNSDTKKRIIISAAISVGSLLLIGLSLYTSSKYSVVPNVYGLSFEAAMNQFNNAELKGTVLLAPSNLDIVSSEDRIVWQSKESGSIAARGDTIYIVIDNCFGYEYNPIHKPVSFIDTREWNWQEDNGWVRICLPNGYVNSRITNPYALTFDVYSDSLAITLQTVVDEYIDSAAHPIRGELRWNIGDFRFIGKLATQDPNESEHRIKCLEVEGDQYSGELFLPAVLYHEVYTLFFSFYDTTGNHYDGSFPIYFVSEYTWETIE